MGGSGFPVETVLGEVDSALAAGHDVVLSAPPGSGKTTCVPSALLNSAWLNGKKIILLEPRRLAARNCAAYIATKRGERVGGIVGYQVRLERCISNYTRLEVLTEGLLTQRIMADPELRDVGLVIFDEFHERSLNCDLAFALALDVKRALRPDLRLMMMSATLDVEVAMTALTAVAAAKEPRLVTSLGRMFPVSTHYLGAMPMSAAVLRVAGETVGDILCFLPGEGEIRRTASALIGKIDAEVLPLYGSLPKDEQDRVFKRSNQRKVILSTSIAETSLTIEGITVVIDSGLMRVPKFSPTTGMTGLLTLPLSMDRAEQRRGRAGRVEEGRCYRLWTEAEEASMPKHALPEILDADLCQVVLTSASWGAFKREDLPWATLPPVSAWEQAVKLLQLLGALDGAGRLTKRGEVIAKLPMHPRLSNMLNRSDCPIAAELAAKLEEGVRGSESDIRFVQLTPRMRQLAKRFESMRPCTQAEGIDSPGAALALAYPDRIARGRGNGTFTMVSGRGAFFEEGDPLAQEPFVVCCQLDDRRGDAKIFLACPIAEGEIERLFAQEMVEETLCEWDDRAGRVKAIIRRRLGGMTVTERPARGEVDLGADCVRALIEGVRQRGVENLPCWTKEALQLKARINFIARQPGLGDEKSWPEISDAAILLALEDFVIGMTKWKDLEALNLVALMDALLLASGHDRRELDRLAPTRMTVPSGSNMLIRYEGDAPTVEVRLQECFGLMATPKVADGRVGVVMTLLSPAQRPCAITQDLASFWREGYPLVRKDLRGRYPRHYWPENPFEATATRRVRPK